MRGRQKADKTMKPVKPVKSVEELQREHAIIVSTLKTKQNEIAQARVRALRKNAWYRIGKHYLYVTRSRTTVTHVDIPVTIISGWRVTRCSVCADRDAPLNIVLKTKDNTMEVRQLGGERLWGMRFYEVEEWNKEVLNDFDFEGGVQKVSRLEVLLETGLSETVIFNSKGTIFLWPTDDGVIEIVGAITTSFCRWETE